MTPLDIALPAGQQPRPLVVDVIHDAFERAMRLADAGAPRPPQLGPTIRAAELARDADDLVQLDNALGELITAAIATRVRVRAALPTRGG